jgi:lipoprotein-releasing system permease protein|tara:strand:+ start:6711 stop:7859 length:1149 start_codon:yes stop_codon:yes gene_type:complete
MKIIFFLIKRLFTSKNSSLVFRLTNFITILSLSLGVSSLSIVVSSIDGFESKISEKLSNLNGYSTINHLFEDEISQKDNYQSLTSNNIPYYEKVALLKSINETQTVVINSFSISDFDKMEIFDSLDINLLNSKSIIIGKSLAKKLDVQLEDQVVIINPDKLDNLSIKDKYDFFKIDFIYDSGIPDFDERNVFTSLNSLQQFFNAKNNISGWIKIKPDNSTVEYPFYEMTIYDKYSSLFEWIDTQKWPIFFIFSLIVLVSFFGLLSSLNILFDEKKMDFSILKVYGLSNKSISIIFISQSILLATIGSILGVLLSYFIIQIQNKFKFISIEENIYFVDYLPMNFNLNISLAIILISIILSIIISSLSVSKFSRFSPTNILREK